MSCACETKKLMSEIERVRRLAKMTATMEGCNYAIYKRDDGTYYFCREEECDKPIIEYITPY